MYIKMPSFYFSHFATILLCIAQVSAHGHVTGIVASGKYFMGYTPNFQYMNPVPKVPAWNAGGYGQGGIVAAQYASVSLLFLFFFSLASL